MSIVHTFNHSSINHVWFRSVTKYIDDILSGRLNGQLRRSLSNSLERCLTISGHDANLDKGNYISLLKSVSQLNIFDDDYMVQSMNENIGDKLEYYKRIGGEFESEITKMEEMKEINDICNSHDVTNEEDNGYEVINNKNIPNSIPIPVPIKIKNVLRGSYDQKLSKLLENSFETVQEIFPLENKYPQIYY